MTELDATSPAPPRRFSRRWICARSCAFPPRAGRLYRAHSSRRMGTRAGWISNLTLSPPVRSGDDARKPRRDRRALEAPDPVPATARHRRRARISVGVVLGVLIGLFSYVRAPLIPLIAALFPIPKIALLPLFVIWFGIDETSKIMLIAFGTFTPTVVATYGAVDNVDRSLIRMGQSFGSPGGRSCRRSCCRGPFRQSCRVSGSRSPSRSFCLSRPRCSGGIRHRRLYSRRRIAL